VQPFRSQRVLCAIANVSIGLTSAAVAASAAECHGGGALRSQQSANQQGAGSSVE